MLPTKKTVAIAIALTLSVPALTSSALAQTKAEKPAAKAAATPKVEGKVSVNGVIIPQAFFDAMNREREASGQAASPEMNAAIRDELINREVLAQAGAKRGLDKDPAVAAQMRIAAQTVLIRAYFEDYSKANPVTDAQLKSMYDGFLSQMGDKEYKARHILVDTEDEAKTIIAQLGRGESFEKLAKDKSKDPGSKDNGGDLDWGPAGRYVPEFGNALRVLQKGQTTPNAIKTQFGWHVIRLDDSRDNKPPKFEDVKENFRQRAQQEMIARLVQDLRSKAKIEEK
ncbi:MAG: peptidylprolyl isomerase [Burkholderiales bacterium]|jgi:peptidyl-prolyl cis-trans isomerase C|nr:peptidylprolyl isomerase [Rhodocyclaceae bacterium]MCA3057222.1 peptidylprolyl isomerase [Rhodocyclaceae bacterium]